MQRVLQIELDIGACNSDRQRQPGRGPIGVGRLHVGLSCLERLTVAAPEVQVVGEVQRQAGVGYVASTVGRRQ